MPGLVQAPADNDDLLMEVWGAVESTRSGTILALFKHYHLHLNLHKHLYHHWNVEEPDGTVDDVILTVEQINMTSTSPNKNFLRYKWRLNH